jgi:hypothetical protein
LAVPHGQQALIAMALFDSAWLLNGSTPKPDPGRAFSFPRRSRPGATPEPPGLALGDTSDFRPPLSQSCP